MEFIYDFADGHTVFSYVSKKNETLDTEAWTVISSGAVSRNLLPVFMRKEDDGYSFTYDIAGMINMMAWKDGQTVNEQMETDRRIEAAVNEVIRRGIPQGEILTEKQYIYVEISTGEIKLICIPVRADMGEDFRTETGKSSGKASAAPLPLIPPEPRGDMPGDIFIEKPVERKSRWWKRKSSEGKKKRERETILVPPIPEEPAYDRSEVNQSSTEWQERGFSEQTGKNNPEKGIWKQTGIQDDFPYRDSRNASEPRDAVLGRTPWNQLGNTLSRNSLETLKPWEQSEAANSRSIAEEQKNWEQPGDTVSWNDSETQNPWEQSETANSRSIAEEQKNWNQPGNTASRNSLETRNSWEQSETANSRSIAEEPPNWNQPDDTPSWNGLEIQKPLERSEGYEPWGQKSNPQIPVPVQMPDEAVQAQDFPDDDSETVLLRDDGDSETVLLRQPQKIAAKLIRINTQEVFSVTTENCKIGKRALMADICIRNNPTISREHCVIRFRDGDYYIEDMDSSNYTYLNGIRVMPGHPKKLQEEDRLRLSDEEFIFRKGE